MPNCNIRQWCDPTYCGGGGCVKVVYVAFIVDVSLGNPNLNNNGCWGYSIPVADSGNWWICTWDRGYSGNESAWNWRYDDTNYSHAPNGDTSVEINVVRQDCAGGRPGTGYEDMAYDLNSSPHWKQVADDVVSLFFAETYVAFGTDEYWTDWYNTYPSDNGQNRVRPLFNAGQEPSTSALQTDTYNHCRQIGAQTWMGVYSGQRPITYASQGGTGYLDAITNGLNACTSGA
jgi:hypothetical protein